MRGIIQKQIKISEIRAAQAFILDPAVGYIVEKLPPVIVYGPVTPAAAQGKVKDHLTEVLKQEAIILIESITERLDTFQMETEQFIQLAEHVTSK